MTIEVIVVSRSIIHNQCVANIPDLELKARDLFRCPVADGYTFEQTPSGWTLCFFFQAEAGIRVLTVTGVQTCALPIYGQRDLRRIGDGRHVLRLPLALAVLLDEPDLGRERGRRDGPVVPGVERPADLQRRTRRSEERRVGKECRSRWSPYH